MVAILYEGKSDGEFFDALLEEYSLPRENVIYKDFEGKDNLFNIGYKYYDEIETDISAGRVTNILIVVDADNKSDPNPNRGFEASKFKLEETIENLAFDVPVDYYIMCDENREGNLESFLLSVLDNKQKECIDSFKDCYKYELTDKWAYNTFYKQKKYPFDFHHQNFNDLKTKLTNLFKEDI
ncbi:MAG: hypothetical protein DRG24_02840 [Epsilonproteobacteria bacterium]|nr:MAG: hypothetical protein DRG24_02840 [Campylobacterota bacterium]